MKASQNLLKIANLIETAASNVSIIADDDAIKQRKFKSIADAFRYLVHLPAINDHYFEIISDGQKLELYKRWAGSKLEFLDIA